MQKSRSPHASNRHLAEAKGSALPSALLFLFLVSAFLMSLSQRAKFQLVGHQLIQDSYRAQTMALLTEQDIQLTHQHGGLLSVGTYVFNAGDVLVEKQGQDTVQLTVTLPSGFTHKHQILLLPAPVPDGQAEESANEEGAHVRHPLGEDE